ncbi:hypothetical protein BH09PSE6_BH09PSE6_04460 [soil metagenome]
MSIRYLSLLVLLLAGCAALEPQPLNDDFVNDRATLAVAPRMRDLHRQWQVRMDPLVAKETSLWNQDDGWLTPSVRSVEPGYSRALKRLTAVADVLTAERTLDQQYASAMIALADDSRVFDQDREVFRVYLEREIGMWRADRATYLNGFLEFIEAVRQASDLSFTERKARRASVAGAEMAFTSPEAQQKAAVIEADIRRAGDKITEYRAFLGRGDVPYARMVEISP